MGQAKARGTFEQRASEAKIKRHQAAHEAQMRQQARLAEEEAARRQAEKEAVRLPDGSRVVVTGYGRTSMRVRSSLLAVAAGAALLGSMR